MQITAYQLHKEGNLMVDETAHEMNHDIFPGFSTNVE